MKKKEEHILKMNDIKELILKYFIELIVLVPLLFGSILLINYLSRESFTTNQKVSFA
jgi:hypothetical protein